jgi:hypothetical protein
VSPSFYFLLGFLLSCESVFLFFFFRFSQPLSSQ